MLSILLQNKANVAAGGRAVKTDIIIFITYIIIITIKITTITTINIIITIIIILTIITINKVDIAGGSRAVETDRSSSSVENMQVTNKKQNSKLEIGNET